MKLSKLLASRKNILRQATLANMAFAYFTLKKLTERISTAGLSGPVRLQRTDENEENFCVTLTALEGSQAVIDEYFLDDDVLKLSDALLFVSTCDCTEVSFDLEDLENFVAPLRAALDEAGVLIDADDTPADYAV